MIGKEGIRVREVVLGSKVMVPKEGGLWLGKEQEAILEIIPEATEIIAVDKGPAEVETAGHLDAVAECMAEEW